MYDENANALPPEMPMDSGSNNGSWTHKIFSKAETIIPIILIILFLLFFAISFMGISTQDIPLIGGFLSDIIGVDKPEILVIGNPLPITQDVILNRADFKNDYRFSRPTDPQRLDRNPIDFIKKYDVVYIDQTDSASKHIPAALADALKRYVNSYGGKVIIVGNSAIQITGRTDLMGWLAVFGSGLAPVDCQLDEIGTRSCENPEMIRGVLRNMSYSNKYLEGFDQIPPSATLATALPLTVYNVDVLGDEWVSIDNLQLGGGTFTGVVVKSTITGGKVVYFNYDEVGIAPGLFDMILKYLT